MADTRVFSTTVSVGERFLEVISIPTDDHLDTKGEEFYLELPILKSGDLLLQLSRLFELEASGHTTYPTAGRALFEIADAPLVIVEQSPPKGISLNDIAEMARDAPGAAMAIAMTGVSPWLVLTIPIGVIAMRVSTEVGTALGDVAGAWIRKLKPKDLPASENDDTLRGA